MPRVLLLLPSATYRASDFLAASRALDTEVVVASERRQAMSQTMGDREPKEQSDPPRFPGRRRL